jgi:hypothetical protein
MDINFIAACLISNNDLNESWKAEGVAARACNGGLDRLPGNEELVARSRAREEAMGRAHIALEKLGLSLPSYNRTQAEVFTDFKGKWGEDPYNGFCWSLAEEALKERERFLTSQEAEWAAFCLEQEATALEAVGRFKRVHA